MKPTNRMIHFKDGQSRLGFQVMLDDEGVEFVHWRGAWTHPSEVPLPRSHEDMIGAEAAPRRIPTTHVQPNALDGVAAFIPTTAKQREVPVA
jgi:hypothetical protein